MGTLKTLFAISVVFAHTYGFVFIGGRNAVQLFYIISGFLISIVLVENKTYRLASHFYFNRYLRLFPIYIVVAILTLFFYYITQSYSGNEFLKNFGRYPDHAQILITITNLTLFLQDWMMFLAIEGNEIIFTKNYSKNDLPLYSGLLVPQAWTLGVEISFYLLAPLIIKNKKILIFTLVCSIGVRITLFLIGLGREDPWVYRFFPAELLFFILGALSHQILVPAYKALIPQDKLLTITNLCTYFLILLTSIYWLIPLNNIFKTILLFTCFTLFLPFTFFFTESNRWDKLVGVLSYPIYISHMLIILVMTFVFNSFGMKNNLILSILVILFTIFFSIMLNKFIAKPFEILRQKVKS
jgi:peptidoglycan/LPS O-acetylase OafA/YrhL